MRRQRRTVAGAREHGKRSKLDKREDDEHRGCGRAENRQRKCAPARFYQNFTVKFTSARICVAFKFGVSRS